MIFLLNLGGFLSSQVMVLWGMKFESTLLMVLWTLGWTNGHFLINVLSMKSSFPAKLTNRLLNQINICFFIMPDFTFMGRGGEGGGEVNFKLNLA